ncbi:peptide/nickel transport system permease protein [Sinosporangium album]|uniref:Peptide/nickel transport system permease protein n=1 Tax=Sinosporangium album TaxID=504805 RepID=A0A1G7Z4Y9_9ACTN|nr:ABC transporter permease [Sinosporangium album]SDH03566.1 peptide/nickel transport system permease protein [Sinosporangium album]
MTSLQMPQTAIRPPQPASPGATPRGVLARLRRRRDARVGLAVLALTTIAIYLGPLLVPYDPQATDWARLLAPPSLEHPLGTDQYGRDQLARILDGGRRSVEAALLVLALSLAAGLAVGCLAGMLGGMVDVVAMRAVDITLALPGLVLTLALLGMLGPGFGNLLIALVLTTWPPYARLARAYVLAGRDRPDVLAARLAGAGRMRAATSHLLPGAVTRVVAVGALDVGQTIVAITGMSYLGLGVQPPAAEWGAMLSDSRTHMADAPWLLLGPGAAIVLVILAVTLLGEAAAEAADPRRAR